MLPDHSFDTYGTVVDHNNKAVAAVDPAHQESV